jgi:hypothetical protein
VAKTWFRRVSDTVTFIRNWAGGANAAYAPQVAAHLDALPPDATLQAISQAMSQGDYLVGTTAFHAKRDKRRALILIRCALFGEAPNFAQNVVANLQDAVLDLHLDNRIGLFRNTTTNALTAAWASLRNNLATFLQNNTIYVRSDNSQGVQTFWFSCEPDSGRYLIEPGAQPRFVGIQIQVNHIPVTHYPIVQHRLTQLAGVTLNTGHPAVTTQLTGCSYVYQINGNNAKAAHIYPAGAIPALQLTTDLRNAPADFAHGNGGHTTVFGAEANNSPAGYVHTGTWTYVVAIYTGAWEIHAQQVPAGQDTPRTYWQIV